MVADFVATASGELFLYVNDAMQVLPLLGQWFYQNNSGTTEVKVQREPLPPQPPQQR